ncbi:MAG TPA: CDP-diacylglycerol--serine O-phosphatidyltransferase [bacterium]|jgi:CDP-diacylglycerol--serine O-phosphatidyltransferase|nr:CDP-diacylglycerol--serine O-phosphatidyltransferase [bacterium]HNT64560.1 CDP-diacylglycerol--serine O-phosphatidyltransferase [bacterium]HOX84597.1 CDP-diacylglycerol--serine O-phosphatidyltransferase [bacterium]HPG45320.1 CDP-diacylglycerol--serine O-phosphatidyltransferase [bacterium]HPM98961.1 CDP-diacylglycerol--serine O-phosphatidyltransferase [bacterium]
MKNKTYINVPTLFSALNLLCGFVSVAQTVANNFVWAAWLIFIAAVFDALDGRIARSAGISSDFGMQVDSLADVVSAGVAPAILLYQFNLQRLEQMGLIIAFLPLLFAAFRLARYNLFVMQNGRTSDYVGMPAPMAANTLASLVILYSHTQWLWLWRATVFFVPLVSLLMISTFRYDGFPRFNWIEKGKNRIMLIFFFIALLFLLITPQYTLFIFMLIYLLSGPFGALLALFKEGKTEVVIIPDDLATKGEKE